MVTIQFIKDLTEQLHLLRMNGKSIGFVPTMGALHAGHISLVKKCIAENDVCVVSIFVNPTQFNDQTDLDKYPRTLEADAELLHKEGVDFLFAPAISEIYPKPDIRVFDFTPIDKVMEGAFRPGHFNGVAQVVSRLFDIVTPNRAYFGEKDFQQVAIIRTLAKQLNLDVEIIQVPIIREASGLALSSRNKLLSPEQKTIASHISATLNSSLNWGISVINTKERVVAEVNKKQGLRVEYFEIVDGVSLQSVSNWSDSSYIVGCITVFCGDVRLIDNITYISSENKK